jgi:hypothetical protein
MTNEKFMKPPKDQDDELVLVESLSFPDGAVMTKDAFLMFLKLASAKEVSTFTFAFIRLTEALIGQCEIIGTYAVREAIVGTVEVQ